MATWDEMVERLTPAGAQRMREGLLEDVLDVVAEQAQESAPKRRGYGSPKSIVSRIKPIVVKTGDWGKVKAGAPHSHLLEFGVKPHSLAPGSGKRRKKRGSSGVMRIYGSGDILRRGARHGGAGARPFMGTAVELSSGETEALLEDSGTWFFSGVRVARGGRRKKKK